MLVGVEGLLEKRLDSIKSKKIGIITNPTGSDSRLNSIVKLFVQNPEINLIALYGPEHGIKGNAQAGECVPFEIDKKFNLPVFSLYGQSQMPDPFLFSNIDKHMRFFDTVKNEKAPLRSMVQDLDIMVYDIQDIGTRIYTYIATMAYCMEICAGSGKEFIVLDRPNPLNGLDMEGPLLDYPRFSSFVGLYPIPVRHGMTVGELAMLFNKKHLEEKVNLTVIPMEGWERDMWYDDTSLPWIMPSPNMPTLDTATVYPGQVFLEGTNLSEGRGTTKPFEVFGAPWIEGYELMEKLNALWLPGVCFREIWFAPMFSKYRGELCGGVQLHVTERKKYKPVATTLHVIRTIRELHPHSFAFHSDYFDKIMGNSEIRERLIQGHDIHAILSPYASDMERFIRAREPYLLY